MYVPPPFLSLQWIIVLTVLLVVHRRFGTASSLPLNLLSLFSWRSLPFVLLSTHLGPESHLELTRFSTQIYSRLLDIQASFDASKQEESKAALSKLRLMVSGSASLPAEIKKRWAAIGGGVLLERYVSSPLTPLATRALNLARLLALLYQVRDDRDRHDHLLWT